MLSPSYGNNKIRLAGTWDSFDQLGNPSYTRDTWQTVTQAASTSIDIDHPVIYVRVSSVGLDTQPASIKLKVTYHMQWFDLEFVSLPTTNLTAELDYDEFEDSNKADAQPASLGKNGEATYGKTQPSEVSRLSLVKDSSQAKRNLAK